jgi:hypothetical protein
MLRERSGVYDPEDLALLGRVFDEAVAALPPVMRTAANRMEIAKIILRRGEVSDAELASLKKLIGAVASAA